MNNKHVPVYLALYWSTWVTWLNTAEYLVILPNFKNRMCCKIYLKDNKHNSLSVWRKIMLRYLTMDIICSPKLTIFLKLHSRKTVRFSEQILTMDKHPSIFPCKREAIGNIIYFTFSNHINLHVYYRPGVHVLYIYKPVLWINWQDRNLLSLCLLALNKLHERAIKYPFIPQLVKSLLFYIPEAWKRYLFWAEPSYIGHYREYPSSCATDLKERRLEVTGCFDFLVSASLCFQFTPTP